MEDPKEFFQENGKYIWMVIIIFFSLLTFFPNLGNNIEPFNLDKIADDGCKSLQTNPPKLDKWCNNLSNESCRTTSCCILMNGQKCVAGDIKGPTFRNRNGKEVDYNYYFFKDKCIGNCLN